MVGEFNRRSVAMCSKNSSDLGDSLAKYEDAPQSGKMEAFVELEKSLTKVLRFSGQSEDAYGNLDDNSYNDQPAVVAASGGAGIPAETAGKPGMVEKPRRPMTRRDGHRAENFNAFCRMKNGEERRIQDGRLMENQEIRHARDEERRERDRRRRAEDLATQNMRALEDSALEDRWKREDDAVERKRSREDAMKKAEWDDAVHVMRNRRPFW